MGFDVARSTRLGNAKASERGTGSKEIPRFLFLYSCCPWVIGLAIMNLLKAKFYEDIYFERVVSNHSVYVIGLFGNPCGR